MKHWDWFDKNEYAINKIVAKKNCIRKLMLQDCLSKERDQISKEFEDAKMEAPHALHAMQEGWLCYRISDIF